MSGAQHAWRRQAALLPCLIIALATMAEKPRGGTAQAMVRQGMVNIHDLDSSIHVSLMYAKTDNFMGEVMYDDLRQAYLHPRAAAALAAAQKLLKRSRPDLSLKVCDACRPMATQERMWNKVKGTRKRIYVSNPAHGGGLHNYGLAVDITLCDAVTGDTLPMGTRVDHMTALSHIDCEDQLVKEHKLPRAAVENRRLLRHTMRQAGFRALPSEWWHFNFCSRATAKRYYKVVR